jgi:iron(III)-enterobactin esterase
MGRNPAATMSQAIETSAASSAACSFALPSDSIAGPCPTITRSRSHPRIDASELLKVAKTMQTHHPLACRRPLPPDMLSGRPAPLMNFARILLSVALLGALVCPLSVRGAESPDTAATSARIQSAAKAFLESLSADQRKLAVFAVDDPERKDWSNLPHTLHSRKGIAIGDLTPAQRVLAHHLIQAGLSSQGYLKTTGIMELDEVLLHLSGQDKADKPMFGLRYYWLSFLGEPSSEKPWGWQLDGHHLALNFSLSGREVAMTPTFMGSDPHEVREGLHAGWRVLGAEDDQGLALMESLRPEQRRKALLAAVAPADVITGPGRDKSLTEVAGLPFSEMDDAQKGLLLSLVDEYVRNYRPDLAARQIDRINRSGWDKVHFAWAGPVGPTAPYYYRVHGPTVLIEFDNNHPPGRKDGPINHIHSVFRDPQNDYGEDLLRRHLQESHGSAGTVSADGDGSFTIGPEYAIDPDLTDRGNPQGKFFEFAMPLAESRIFRGDDATLEPAKKPVRATRRIWVYVPAAYKDGAKAPLLIIHDGPGQMGLVRNALDNLTGAKDPKRSLPAFIAVAVENGGDDGKNSQRGLEYDTMSDRLARFINDEVLAAVLANPKIRAAYPHLAFTDDPWGRCVLGCSSGGAAALTMAWFRPDLFRRVMAYSGTFVDQQDDDAPEEAQYPLGAWEYHSAMKLIQSGEKKPLRIFTHVSEKDLRPNDPEETYHNWVMAGKRTEAALAEKGYPHRFVYSLASGHCDRRVFEQTLADTLVWVWSGYVAE